MCVYMRVYACMSVYLYVCMNVCICICVYMYVCMYVLGTIDEFSGKTGDNADSFDWSQSTPKTAQTTDDFDWSQPVSAPVEDELVLTFDDDDDDDKDDTDEEPDSDDTEQKVTSFVFSSNCIICNVLQLHHNCDFIEAL